MTLRQNRPDAPGRVTPAPPARAAEPEPVTPALAQAAGLPVFLCCEACRAPSRPLDLAQVAARLGPDLDLARAAAAGRFRCAACGARRAGLMPTLSMLIIRSRRLRMRCSDCDKDRALTAVEACDAYGIATPFDALRRSLRCPQEPCRMNAGAMTPDEQTEAEYKRARDARKSAAALAVGKSEKVRDCGWL